MSRQCGDCTLCCRLLPVPPLGKLANTRCQHQKIDRGCAIYEKRPGCCRTFACAWLVDPETGDLSRPDRSRYVIDISLDYISIRNDDSGEIERQVPVMQIWLDPAEPDAWRDDKALRAYLARRGEQGIAALMRNGAEAGFVVFPPALASDGEWHVNPTKMAREVEHKPADIARVMLEAGVRIEYTVAQE